MEQHQSPTQKSPVSSHGDLTLEDMKRMQRLTTSSKRQESDVKGPEEERKGEKRSLIHESESDKMQEIKLDLGEAAHGDDEQDRNQKGKDSSQGLTEAIDNLTLD